MADPSPLAFFDADLGIGASGLGLPSLATPADALALMDRYVIASAIVYDRHAHEAGLFDRFDPLLDFCRQSPRLLPAIPILPPACGEQPPPEELVALILDCGIKAVRASPEAHRFPFDPFALGPVLEILEKHRIPVLYDSMHLQDHPWEHTLAWQDLRSTALAFPGLPIIAIYNGMLQGRHLLPLLEQCPNVLADLTCVSFQFIEFVVERFGSHRLILASHFPSEDPSLYTTWVNYAGLDEFARRDIAHDNIARLVGAIA